VLVPAVSKLSGGTQKSQSKERKKLLNISPTISAAETYKFFH
jgi:hypothetical protein